MGFDAQEILKEAEKQGEGKKQKGKLENAYEPYSDGYGYKQGINDRQRKKQESYEGAQFWHTSGRGILAEADMNWQRHLA